VYCRDNNKEADMTFLAQLWMPILVSAVLVFIASSLIHMVFKWHNAEYRKLANEDAVRAAVRAGNPAPGQYVVPHCADMKDMGTPEMQQKFIDGPIAFMTVRPSGKPSMGAPLAQWFAFAVLISVIVAYVAFKTLPPGPSFYQVCRVVGAMALLAYGAGSVLQGIWFGKPWSSVAKDLLDAVIYAVIMALTFAYLWPNPA
jgi:hypothetical protein